MIQDDDIQGKIYDRRLFRRMMAYMVPYRHILAGAVGMIIIAAVLQLVGPLITKLAIDDYIATGDLNGLNKLVVIYFSVLILTFFIQYFQAYLTQYLGQKLMYDLRSEIFTHLQSLSLRFFDRNPVGRLMTRVTSDVESLNQMFTQGVVNIFGDLFLLLGIVSAMLYINWKLALWTFAIIPVLFLITHIFKTKVRVAFRQVRKWLAQINTLLQENITGMRIVQVFNREEENFKQFSRVNAQYTRAYVRMIFYYAVFYPAIEVVSAVAIALVLWRGGMMRLEEAVSYGTLVAFIQFAEKFFRPISDLSEKYNVLQGAMAASERIFKLLDTNPDITNPSDSYRPEQVNGEIVFDKVWFAYNEEDYVLRDISFRIAAGESIAVVGHTGAGKTSMINLLSRQYDINRGEILLDGVDVRRWDLPALRGSMALVLQDVFLFSDTIMENIRLGNKDISDGDVVAACKKVYAHEFIEQLPRKYETVLTERGLSLSMGQRQLLAFARAIACNPRILILDEATSNIDSETEQLIQKAMTVMMQERTSIVIAHRLSTIQHADRILLFHKGKLREQGTHEQLMSQKGLYFQLYQLQYKDQQVLTG
ncbi:MAG TPA: ABC transporter ATP-binding protein [Caldithrix abyssi]|uniref:ABC transporter ATP-binding protein n=1 Tax=Caldithrix abyssi TaxID=187145 RepID=A0A7V4UCK6_CALAY|nr:ABC transporter ATP-binding protein [Caldithrix abyssi]